MAFRLLALVASDRSKAEIIIAYPVCNIMEETSSVIVCSVNIGNLIITRREVLEACITEAVPIVFVLRKVPTIVTAHTFCASRDTRVSYGWCPLIQEYFCAV